MENIKKYEVKCFGINDLGQGKAFIDKKKEIIVPYLLPKEVGIIEYDKYLGKVKLVKVLKESSQREKPKCEIYRKCGSCQILHMKYSEQMNFKKELVSKIFKD